MSWSPDQYLKFAAPRFRPAMDLLQRITIPDPGNVYDLGCGPGNVTRMLVERWPGAAVTGVDDSAAMLAKAARELPGVTWVQQSLVAWRPARPADVIYSNAALHWMPNHEKYLPALVAQLAPGGVLAAQMPQNFAAPSHTLITDTIRAGKWRSRMEHLIRPAPVGDPAFYYSLLAPLAKNLDIWETEYLQVLEGRDPVKEWTKGTWLRQFLDVLDESEAGEFEVEYARRVRDAYPPLKDGNGGKSGKTLFPFKRLFIVLQAG